MTSLAYANATPSAVERAAIQARIVVHAGTRQNTPTLAWDEHRHAMDLRSHPWNPGPADADDVVVTADGLPIVWVEGAHLQVGFDWWAFEEHALQEQGLPQRQPAYSKSGIAYTRIPFQMRAHLNRARIAALRLRADDSGFPAGPVETGLDALRELIWTTAARLTGTEASFPRARELVLTHDLDEGYGWPGVAQLRQVERALGVVSAVGVVSERYRLQEEDLRALVDDGCEVFSHGYLHDGTCAFLPSDELRRRLNHFFVAYPSMREHVHGFRAGQLVRSAHMFQLVAEVFDYDMTPPTVELGGPHGYRTGCATTIPFTDAHGLVHLPLTLPQDYFPAFINRMRPEQITDLWLSTTEQVWAVGGTAVHLVHPDNVLRRPALLKAYRDYLEAVLDRGAVVRLPGEVMTMRGVRK